MCLETSTEWWKHLCADALASKPPSHNILEINLMNRYCGYCYVLSKRSLKMNHLDMIDHLMLEHLKYASHHLNVLMTVVLQSVMTYRSFPQQCMTTMLVPILKNRNGDIASKLNSRLITLSTVASRIFEIILIKCVEEYLWKTENQSAYKKVTPLICVWLHQKNWLCITILYYMHHNTLMPYHGYAMREV